MKTQTQNLLRLLLAALVLVLLGGDLSVPPSVVDGLSTLRVASMALGRANGCVGRRTRKAEEGARKAKAAAREAGPLNASMPETGTAAGSCSGAPETGGAIALL